MSENPGGRPQPTHDRPAQDTTPHDAPSHDAVPELEVDESVAPRPEEEVADADRGAV